MVKMDDVNKIRKAYFSNGETKNEIAKKFNVSQGTVSNLKREAIIKGFLAERGELTEEGERFVDKTNNSNTLGEC